VTRIDAERKHDFELSASDNARPASVLEPAGTFEIGSAIDAAEINGNIAISTMAAAQSCFDTIFSALRHKGLHDRSGREN
jgi:hypothetical protein